MEHPLNIAICEDSPEDEKKLLTILAGCSIPSHPRVFHCGEDLLADYTPMFYDLLLSDIYMTGITGVETVTRIRQIDQEIPVAFVTTSSDFALESYRLSVLKYIEKPYSVRDIEEILQLARMKRDSAPSLAVQRSGKEERLPYSRILYLEQQTHQLNIVMANGEEISVYEKLGQLMPQLEKFDFYSPHKSYAVNLGHVRGIDPELRCFLMNNGINVPIRRETMPKARRAFEDYLFRRTEEGTV